MRLLCIGDPHFKVDNIPDVEEFIDKVVALSEEKDPDAIVVLGDLLHTHEKIHTIPLNKAYELVARLAIVSRVFVLVGNHDLLNNQQFCSEAHWMNGMKQWEKVTIVDQPTIWEPENYSFVFLPYVPPGRLLEALDSVDRPEGWWKEVNALFTHQEFRGCKMGAIISEIGDLWDLNWPLVVSGHIHDKQTPQPNLYYTGSSMQHAFGETSDKTIALVIFEDDGEYQIEELDLGLRKKRIKKLSAKEIREFQPKGRDQYKLQVDGTHAEFLELKKTPEYQELVGKGVKIAFKEKRNNNSEQPSYRQPFAQILFALVEKKNRPGLYQLYHQLIQPKEGAEVVFEEDATSENEFEEKKIAD